MGREVVDCDNRIVDASREAMIALGRLAVRILIPERSTAKSLVYFGEKCRRLDWYAKCATRTMMIV